MLQLANSTLAGLRKAYDEIGAEQAARIQEHQHNGSQANQIQSAQPALDELRSKITARRAEISQLRLARSARVADQLLQIRREAAERVVVALAELDDASLILITCAEEIRFAGDPDAPHLNFVPSHSMRDHATRILGGK